MNNTILVVEDEEYNFTLLKLIFEKEGQTILWAQNGVEALDIFRENKDIKLVLMDIKIPLMDGIEVTKEIKKIDHNMPVIAITAYAMTEDKQMCLEAGCNEFISKPLNRADLLETARKWISF